MWVGDWAGPSVVRVRAVGSPTRHTFRLPTDVRNAGVWNVAVGAGFVWATTPRDGTLWRIDPRTGAVTRVRMQPYLPTGVTTSAGEVWVTVRGR